MGIFSIGRSGRSRRGVSPEFAGYTTPFDPLDVCLAPPRISNQTVDAIERHMDEQPKAG